MAKVSPVMKHAKPQLTAEQVAIEDFINAIPPEVVREGDPALFANNSITEVIETPETSLDPIVDSVAAADSLDELAGDIDGVTTAIAMESYKRIFQQLTEFSGHPVASLENFPATKGGVRKFAKSVRGHAELIRGCVTIALEEFGTGVEESIGTSMSNYKQALGKLNQVREDDFAAESEITINYKAFWKLFHMNDELMSAKDFGLEVDGVKKLAALVSQGKDNIQKWSKGEDSAGTAIEGKTFVQLMNNTDVTVKDGRGKWVTEDVPPPKNNEGKWTAGDWFWVLVFSWAGLIYRIIKGGSGTDQAKKEQSLKAIHQVIGEMKRLAPIVQGIEKDAKEIVAACNQAQADRQGDLKRAASPVLELAAKTISHVTEVTYGAMKLFDQAENSADKQEREDNRRNR
jgi:hypothetical protein